MRFKLFMTVALVAIVALALMPVDAFAQPGWLYDMTLLDENDGYWMSKL